MCAHTCVCVTGQQFVFFHFSLAPIQNTPLTFEKKAKKNCSLTLEHTQHESHGVSLSIKLKKHSYLKKCIYAYAYIYKNICIYIYVYTYPHVSIRTRRSHHFCVSLLKIGTTCVPKSTYKKKDMNTQKKESSLQTLNRAI